jgi:polyisoprenoid-binding protein YceI
MRIALALIAITAVATPVIAQQAMTKPGSKNPALVTAGSYTIDPNHTLVQWDIDHLGITPYFGLFGDISGKLTIDPKQPASAHVSVTIPLTKLTVNPALNEHLQKGPATPGGKPDFFGPSPADATFVSTAVAPTGSQKAKVTGNLTLNGVTKPVTLNVEFYGAGKLPAQMGGGEGLGFTASGVIKRSEFGLGGYVPIVGDDVTLKIAAAFNKD